MSIPQGHDSRNGVTTPGEKGGTKHTPLVPILELAGPERGDHLPVTQGVAGKTAFLTRLLLTKFVPYARPGTSPRLREGALSVGHSGGRWGSGPKTGSRSLFPGAENFVSSVEGRAESGLRSWARGRGSEAWDLGRADPWERTHWLPRQLPLCPWGPASTFSALCARTRA